MMQQFVLTIIGDDRPGLVDAIAGVVKQHGGSWLESRMANLEGKFSGIVLVSVNQAQSAEFKTAVLDLKNHGLSVRATPVEGEKERTRQTKTLSLVANDRPGILSELSAVLAQLNLNVEDLVTSCEPAPMSGELLFNAKLQISVPSQFDDEDLRTALESLADDLMVEID